MFAAGKSPCSLAQGCAISRKGTGAKKSIVKLAVKLELCCACINCIKLTVEMICKSIQTFLSFIIFYLAILPRPCRHVGGWIDCGVAGKKFGKSVDFVSLLSAFFSFPLPCSAQIQDRAASPFRPSIDAPFRVWTSGADHCVWFMIRSSLQIACMKQLFVEWRICFQKVLVFLHLVFCSFPLVLFPVPFVFLLLCQWVLAADLLWVAVAYRDRRQVQEEEMRQRHGDLCALSCISVASASSGLSRFDSKRFQVALLNNGFYATAKLTRDVGFVNLCTRL